jgi:hypothetical protein
VLLLLQTLATITGYLPTLTVGLVATLTSVACIIAADTGELQHELRKDMSCTKMCVLQIAVCLRCCICPAGTYCVGLH